MMYYTYILSKDFISNFYIEICICSESPEMAAILDSNLDSKPISNPENFRKLIHVRIHIKNT